jgi:hypothetical protein
MLEVSKVRFEPFKAIRCFVWHVWRVHYAQFKGEAVDCKCS